MPAIQAMTAMMWKALSQRYMRIRLSAPIAALHCSP